MLTATPKRWFSWNYTVSRDDDRLADLDISWWREKGSLAVDGRRYAVYRERPMSGKFILESDGAIVASAEKPSSLKRRLLIEHAGRRYELKPRSMFTRTFDLREGSTVVGSLSARGFFSRRMNVDLPETLPLPVRMFVTWLTVLLWKRESEAAAAGS
ncbi:MAG TPA: hypothetical protein VNQ32_08855 [Steroidobacteraceae bacterium]|nr:hypothetical protein [Steroidobacteraceae bacterium]